MGACERVWICETKRDLDFLHDTSVINGTLLYNLKRHFPCLKNARLSPEKEAYDPPKENHAIIGICPQRVQAVVYDFHEWAADGKFLWYGKSEEERIVSDYLSRDLTFKIEKNPDLRVRPVGGLVFVVNGGVDCSKFIGGLKASAGRLGKKVRIEYALERDVPCAERVNPEIPGYDDGQLLCPF